MVDFQVNLDSVCVPLPSSGRKAPRGILPQELGQGLPGEERTGFGGGGRGHRATGDDLLLLPASLRRIQVGGL